MAHTKHDIVYLMNIQHAARNVQRFARDKTWKQIATSDVHAYALTRGFQLLSANIRKLSDKFRKQHNTFDWYDFVTTCQERFHDFHNIDFKLMLSIIHKTIPDLLNVVSRAIAMEKERERSKKK